jgi:hypothetical protein
MCVLVSVFDGNDDDVCQLTVFSSKCLSNPADIHVAVLYSSLISTCPCTFRRERLLMIPEPKPVACENSGDTERAREGECSSVPVL